MKNAFGKLLGAELSELQWRRARLPPKSGGFRLRTGVTTTGAAYALSIVKNKDYIEKFCSSMDVEFDAKATLNTDAI